MPWIIQGEKRRDLIRRFVHLQMQQVYRRIISYTNKQMSVEDLCLDNLLDWIPNELVAGFMEEPTSAEERTEMSDIYDTLALHTEVDDPCH